MHHRCVCVCVGGWEGVPGVRPSGGPRPIRLSVRVLETLLKVNGSYFFPSTDFSVSPYRRLPRISCFEKKKDQHCLYIVCEKKQKKNTVRMIDDFTHSQLQQLSDRIMFPSLTPEGSKCKLANIGFMNFPPGQWLLIFFLYF